MAESPEPPPPISAAAAGIRPRRRFGILHRMLLAFSVVAAMAVTAGIGAWLSLRGIEAELVHVIHQAVPAMSVAEALAVEASAIVGTTSTLTAALSEEQRAALMVSLAGRIATLHRRLTELAALRVGDGVLTPLRERIGRLSTNLRRQGELVGQRIALRKRVQNDAAALARSHKAFLAAVDPRIEETYRALFAGIKTLVADLGGASAPALGAEAPARPDTLSHQDMLVLQRRMGLLFNRNVGEILALLQLAASGNLAAGLLNEVILVTDPAQVQQLRSQFGEITIAMGTIRLNLATTADNQVLLGLTTPMLQYGLGGDNLFDRRLQELELIRASDAVVAENRTLSDALTEAVDHLVATSRAEAEHSAAEVEADAAYARLMGAGAALLAVLVAVLIGWRYVGRQIIGRLLALQQAMEGEAAGREIMIPAGGDDEIGDMAGALSHFVARRKQAEADLRSAKDRAEGAFAELKDLQQTLVQTEKMAALGGLVAGVAHELNTPAGVCLTAVSLLTEKTEDLARSFASGQLRKSRVQDYLEVSGEVSGLIRSNLERAGDLIRVFKQVAIDPSEDERQIFRVSEHIEMAVGLLAEKLRLGGHTVSIDCPSGLTLDGFPEALRQALTVLIDNAVTHAFAERENGAITISGAEGAAGTVVLTITDDGAGIRAEDQPRLFEPFFTTRRSQGGIGLGLHMVFNIVSSVLGGRIAVESEPGRGCRFVVTLPSRSPATPGRRRG
ncbi:MAG: ATP-binding protein [Rhodospirillaceae bacterium]